LLEDRTVSAGREAAITMLSATLVRSAQESAVQTILRRAAETTHPDWQRSAIVRGAEVALLGAAAPGNPAGRGRGGAAGARGGDSTAPGGRAGPGGAPAFPREGAPGRAANAAEPGAAPAFGGGRGGRGGGGPLRVNREPTAFRELSAAGGDLGTRAAAVLARIEWPGKPGASAPVAPLTADEQQRFDAGQTIYQSICQPCHQDDGRGKEMVAPALVGSPFATAAPSIAVRILINGKEGPTGLMPPLGQTFTDEQIANVLTYVRRQWGNTASPVDTEIVKDTRAEIAGRTRPWTNAELAALATAGRGGRQ
jgi:mono/diheme cytochrome c family protein